MSPSAPTIDPFALDAMSYSRFASIIVIVAAVLLAVEHELLDAGGCRWAERRLRLVLSTAIPLLLLSAVVIGRRIVDLAP